MHASSKHRSTPPTAATKTWVLSHRTAVHFVCNEIIIAPLHQPNGQIRLLLACGEGERLQLSSQTLSHLRGPQQPPNLFWLLLLVATKQSWFCCWCWRHGQMTAVEVAAASGGGWRNCWQKCLCPHSVLLVLPPLAFLCKEVGARAHPVAGKIVSFAVLRSLQEDVGALLSYSKTPHRAEWTKRSPLQMGSGGQGLHLVVGLLVRAPKDSWEHRQHFCSGCCTSALVMTELWQNFCLDFHF